MSKKKFAEFGLMPGEFRSVGRIAAVRRRELAAGVCLGSARAALAEFGRGKHIFLMNKGGFSMIDLVSAVLEHTGPGALSCWTWCIAPYEIEAVSAFLADGRIQTFRLVCDWSMAQRDMPLVGEMQEKYGADCIRVTKNHAKVFTVSTQDGWKVVARGSANLNKNARFENFDCSDDPEVFQVVAGIETELWQRGKPLPVGKLRHSDAANLLDAASIHSGGSAVPIRRLRVLERENEVADGARIKKRRRVFLQRDERGGVGNRIIGVSLSKVSRKLSQADARE